MESLKQAVPSRGAYITLVSTWEEKKQGKPHAPRCMLIKCVGGPCFYSLGKTLPSDNAHAATIYDIIYAS